MVAKCRRTRKMSRENETVEPGEKERNECCPIQSDLSSICLLMFLYVMQGIPLGLAAAVPYILQSDVNTANYQTQATFSLALWPFSLKLLWAPLVDSVYSSRFGRRKSWLIPAQYAIGFDLLVMAARVDTWLGRDSGNPWGSLGVSNPVCIYRLTAAFFGLTLLAATQDIAVDGWALTMLSKRNVSWASTCNSVGQVLGYVTAFVLFLCLESPDISNSYLRWTPVEGRGLVSFSGFLYFWGIAFLVTTTVVMVLKHEERSTFTQPIKKCLDETKQKISASKAVKHVLIHSKSTRYRTGRNIFTEPSISPDDECETEVSVVLPDKSELSLLSSTESNGLTLPTAVDCRWQDDFITNDSTDAIEVFQNEPIPGRSNTNDEEYNESLSLIDTYRVMLGILCLKPVLQYIGIIFLIKGCLAAADGATTLKLIERGVPKERLAFLSIILLPAQAVLPLLITQWSNGPRPLSVYAKLAPLRLLMTVTVIPLVYYTPWFAHKIPVNSPHNLTTGSLMPSVTSFNSTFEQSTIPVQYQTTFTWKFYSLILVQMALYTFLSNMMHVCQMAFQARISDPTVGGTYMTLLNTAVNLAGVLPGTLVLYLIDPLSIRHCVNPDPLKAGLNSWRALANPNHTIGVPDSSHLLHLGQQWITQNATCRPKAGVLACELAAGECVTTLDGYYLQVALSILFGIIAFPLIVRPLARRLDVLTPSAYMFRLPSASLCSRKKPYR